jgi:nucleolar complex protein 3
VDYIIDLIAVLKALIHQGDLSLESSLYCTFTGLQIVSDHTDFLDLDPKEFYQQLYSLMLSTGLNRNEHTLYIILKCLEFCFLKKKQLSLNRVAAFLKRLAIISLHLPTFQLLACLVIMKQFFQVSLCFGVRDKSLYLIIFSRNIPRWNYY